MKLNNIIFYDDFMHPSESILLKKEFSKQFNLIVLDHYFIDFFLNDTERVDSKELRNIFIAYKDLDFKQKRIFNIVKWLVGHYKPVVVVFGFNGFLYESLMSSAFKKLGVKTISIAHSGLGHLKNFDGIHTKDNYLLCWNEYDKAALAQYGDVDCCKIVDVGALKYIKDYDIYNRNIKKKIIKISNNILICTSNINTSLSLIISDPKKHQNNLNQIKSWAAERKDKNFYIKTHPSYDYYTYYNYLYSDIKNIKIVNSNYEIKNIKFDVAIAMNYCTTYMLELMLKNIPSVLYEESIYNTNGSKNILPNHIITRLNDFNQLKILIDDNNSLNEILSTQDFYIKTIVNKKDLSIFISDVKISLNKLTHHEFSDSNVGKLINIILKMDIFKYFVRSLKMKNIMKFDDYIYINYILCNKNIIKKIILKFLMIPYIFRNLRNKRLVKQKFYNWK